jgi:hypothetical protein
MTIKLLLHQASCWGRFRDPHAPHKHPELPYTNCFLGMLSACSLFIAGCRASDGLSKRSFATERRDIITVPAFWGNAAPTVYGGSRFKAGDLPCGPGLYVFLINPDGAIELNKERVADKTIRFCVWNGLTSPVVLKTGGDLAWVKSIEMRSEEGEVSLSGGSRRIEGWSPVLSDSSVDGHFVLLNGSGNKLSSGYDGYEFGISSLDRCAYPSSWTGTAHMAFALEGYVFDDKTPFQATLSIDLPVLRASVSDDSLD